MNWVPKKSQIPKMSLLRVAAAASHPVCSATSYIKCVVGMARGKGDRGQRGRGVSNVAHAMLHTQCCTRNVTHARV